MRKFLLFILILCTILAYFDSKHYEADAQGFGRLHADKAMWIKTDTTQFIGQSGGVLGASDTTVQIALQSLSASPVSIVTSGSNADSSTTQSDSGLEFVSGELTMLRGCSDNQILKWDETDDDWNCEADGGGGGGAYSDLTDSTADTTLDFTIYNNAWTGSTFTNTWTSSTTDDSFFVIDVQALTTGDAIVLDVGHSQTGSARAFRLDNDGTEKFFITPAGGVSADSYTTTGTGQSTLPAGLVINNNQFSAAKGDTVINTGSGEIVHYYTNTWSAAYHGFHDFTNTMTFFGRATTDCSTETDESSFCWDLDDDNFYIGTGSTAKLINDGTGGGSAGNYDDLGDPLNDSGLTFGTFNNIWTFSSGQGSFYWTGNTNAWTFTSSTNLWTAASGSGSFFTIGNDQGSLFDVDHNGTVSVGKKGSCVDADPCGSYVEGTLYYSCGGVMCFCDGAGVDLQTDNSTACSY